MLICKSVRSLVLSRFTSRSTACLVRNSIVIAFAPGDERRTCLSVSATLSGSNTCWVAAHVRAQKLADEAYIEAHTNPICLAGRNAVPISEARCVLTARWKADL